MVDVNTIVGSPVSTADGNVVLTVSQVAFGFVPVEVTLKVILFPKNIITDKGSIKRKKQAHPFGGGSGLGFLLAQLLLVVGSNGVQVLHLNSSTHLIEKALNTVPSTVDKFVNGR